MFLNSLHQQAFLNNGINLEGPESYQSLSVSWFRTINRKHRPVMPEFNDNRKISLQQKDIYNLQNVKNSPISYLVENNLSTPYAVGSPLSYHIPLIHPLSQPCNHRSFECGDICFPKNTQLILDNIQHHKNEWEHTNVSEHETADIERNTRGQLNRKLWFLERKKRITASNFGAIINRKKDVNDAFLKNTIDAKEFSAPSTSYGTSNETVAKQMYINQTSNHLHDIGFVINPSYSFIGATPDGIVCDSGVAGILEVKCPYSVRDLTISEAHSVNKDFFLMKVDDKFTLCKNHKHWHQVKGQLLVIGAQFCDLVTFTRQDLHIERIYPDKTHHMFLLEKLSNFYVNYFKPYFNN